MALSPPKVKWYNAESYIVDSTTIPANTQEQTEWNVGVVDAGSYSLPDDPTIPDDPNKPPTTFLIWNNRYDAVSNPTANAEAVSDMTNVTITTLSLVRDAEGNIDPNLSYQPSGVVADLRPNVNEATVQVIFFDSSKAGGAGQWGTYADDGVTWQPNKWKDIGGTTKAIVVSMSGAKGIIKGLANTASLATDKQNYAKVKMRLYVRPNATAGKVEWVTRVSYQYQG